MQIKTRNFFNYILFTIITCGFYSIYMQYDLTKDINVICSEDGKKMDPVMVIILTILTCGLYYIYWLYVIGNRIQNHGNNYGITIDENGVAYLLWQIIGSLICGLGSFVAIFLLFKNVNLLSENYNSSYNTIME